MISRPIVFLTVCCCYLLSVIQSPAAPSKESHATRKVTAISDCVTSLSRQAKYANAIVSVAVLDPQTSEVLFEHNSSTAMIPASCMKILSSATAMHFLGPDHRFTTTLEASGIVTSGVLEGDIIIRGGGDPCLASDRVEDSMSSESLLNAWVDAVKASGIRSIKGGVLADDTFLPREPLPDNHTIDDIGNYYAAGTCGLTFHDNLYYLTLRPGAQVGAPAEILRASPPLPGMEWTNQVTTAAPKTRDGTNIYGYPDTFTRVITGTIPLGGEFTVKGSLPAPALTAAQMLEDRLVRAGIPVDRAPGVASETVTTSTHMLAQTMSPPLAKIIRTLNKQSFNLYAEMMLMLAGKAAGTTSREEAIKAEKVWLESIGTPLNGFRIDDGSGLSRGDTVTAHGMVRLLAALQRQSWFETWKSTLPILGIDGDLRDRQKDSPLRGRVQAKTGLISRVRGHCGYLQARSGSIYCFAIIVNYYTCPWAEVDSDTDAILMAIYNSL
ncbi:MAG: D-alanyl-D-alanine carboxypeptidase/D-alanyl-D-alanine-endopeptidase [Candidatus Sumerlaeaceae bacterium]|nr:D-alanyl-D-alanine carboxypeptidase/D-alanyl-D-alanine-endopeptidase [Candidatus Sumerlaeaceae bacterium]